MSLIPIDVAISAPTAGTFSSGLDQSTTLSFNPGFLFGNGTQTSSGGSPSSGVSGGQNPITSDPSSAAANAPQAALPATLPVATAAAATSSSLIWWLLIGGALILAMGGHK